MTRDPFPMRSGMRVRTLVVAAAVVLASHPGNAADAPALFQCAFADTRYGHIPGGWRDLVDERPSRNWAVDGNGFLRPVLKLRTGLIVYDGYTTNAKPARALTDARLTAEFKT